MLFFIVMILRVFFIVMILRVWGMNAFLDGKILKG